MITIIDTSALITLYQLNKIEYLNTMFNEVYVPRKVEEEFLKIDTDNKLRFLFNFYETNYWFKACQSYDIETMLLLQTEPKIDDGESEAISQYRQLQSDLKIEEGNITCIIDERHARTIAGRMDIKINGTLYLLARMHFNGYLNYFDETKSIKKERRFSQKYIDAAFEKVKNELGIN